jgi:hypothetical protein
MGYTPLPVVIMSLPGRLKFGSVGLRYAPNDCSACGCAKTSAQPTGMFVIQSSFGWWFQPLWKISVNESGSKHKTALSVKSGFYVPQIMKFDIN